MLVGLLWHSQLKLKHFASQKTNVCIHMGHDLIIHEHTWTWMFKKKHNKVKVNSTYFKYTNTASKTSIYLTLYKQHTPKTQKKHTVKFNKREKNRHTLSAVYYTHLQQNLQSSTKFASTTQTKLNIIIMIVLITYDLSSCHFSYKLRVKKQSLLK